MLLELLEALAADFLIGVVVQLLLLVLSVMLFPVLVAALVVVVLGRALQRILSRSRLQRHGPGDSNRLSFGTPIVRAAKTSRLATKKATRRSQTQLNLVVHR